MMSDGYLQADFAVRRNNFNLYKLPGAPPDFVKADNNPMSAKDAAPNMPALKALLTRLCQRLRTAGEPALASDFAASASPRRLQSN